MNGWFDCKSFNTYYLGKSKYEKKKALLDAFYMAWYNVFGWGLAYEIGVTRRMNKLWTAEYKKKIKIILLGWGYTSGGIEGLFRAFTEWNKNAPK